jgi:hypothetical protein
MRYQEPTPIEHSAAVARLLSDDLVEVATTLVSAAFYDPDWRWVESECMRLIEDPHADIRGVAATCIGHLARIHGVISERARSRVEAMLGDTEVAGVAKDALDDIRQFAGSSGPTN